MGRNWTRQPFVYKRSILDTAYRRAVAGFAARIRRLEKHSSPLHALARQGDLGETAGAVGERCGQRMADDRCQPHQGSPRCRRGSGWQPRHGGYKRGLNTKLHLAVDAHGMPIRVIITAGTTADCTCAGKLIEGLSAENLLADRGYDTNEIIDLATKQGMKVQIPPKRNRKEQREYDKALYKHRHLVENAFLHLKRWRGIATRYAKSTASFLAAVHIRCIALWARIL